MTHKSSLNGKGISNNHSLIIHSFTMSIIDSSTETESTLQLSQAGGGRGWGEEWDFDPGRNPGFMPTFSPVVW
jgi:hypothetical protein